MLSQNQNITIDGQSYRIVQLVGCGGEGEAYKVVDSASGQQYLLKRFHEHHDTKACLQRTEYLLSRDLQRLCCLLTPPIRIVRPHGSRSWCGYLATYRRGTALDELLYVPEVDLVANLQLAVALVYGIDVIHQAGISHGDIHPRNVIVEHKGDVLIPAWIDLDNFNAPGVSPSNAWGALEYMAPEVRLAMANNKPCPPGIEADLFALTCLLHEVLLVRHAAAGNDQTPESFNQAMTCGRWLQDPANGSVDHQALGGLSNLVVNTNLASLLRRGLSVDPKRRPTAAQWREALVKATDQVYLCPECGYPNLIDASKQSCPSCKASYPVLMLQVEGGAPLVINQSALVVGKAQLYSPHVSAKHAVLRRIGPETWLEPYGRNGTYRWTEKGNWTRLNDGQRYLLEVGDRLRFADSQLLVQKFDSVQQ